MFRRLIGLLQKRVLGYEVEVLTFSQAGEDLVIRNVFYKRLSEGQDGFYVDIGAFHPYRHSNTYYLYRCGWRGINIDARPGSMRMFRQLRPRDINLEVGVATDEGLASYYDLGEHAGMNSFSLEYIEHLENSSRIQQVLQIPTKRLTSLLEQYLPEGRVIDFLNIDVEGSEYGVLSSNDWKKYRPRLIAAEVCGYSLDDILDAPASRLLIEQHYELYARVILSIPGVNTVFFVDTMSDLKSTLSSTDV